MSVINTNLNALVSQESSRASNLRLSQSMERLSTGQRINSAKDDAAGLAITNRMTSQVRGIQMAVKNSNDAISMTQTAEGAYGQVGNILQRMRELAVQAATGTVSNADRSSLQLEVDQLKQEIDHIAKTTNFNNINLLDGSAKNVVIQTGANQQDTIKMGFDSVKTNHIGSDVQPSVTSISGTFSSQMGALSTGDLIINGVAIGPTYASDDRVSTDGAAASAIAKAAAINLRSNESGVVAKAGVTTVSGSEMTGAASTGSITINGVTTASIATTTDTALSRKLVTDAINAISTATGVKATDTGSDKNGIVLTAADGRNIQVNLGNLSAASTGLAAANTYVGSYELFSTNGGPIKIDSREGTTQDTVGKAGLRIGTFDGSKAETVTRVRSITDQGNGLSSAGTGTLSGHTLMINGVAIGAAVATDDTASYQTGDTTTGSQRSASAIAIAAAINKQSERTGVTAQAEANVLRGSSFAAANTVATVNLNGVTFTTDLNDLQNVIDSFNEVSGRTGVIASRFGDAMQLVAADGRNIAIGATLAPSAASLGLDGITIGGNAAASLTTHYSTVKLSSETAFKVEAGFEGTANFEKLGFRAGTFGGAAGDKIADVNISTQQGATDALRAIDAAINQVSAAQAKSGALNNRLDVIVNNLSEGLQNISASRSRILDTNYATETTELAKQQIIQQAATAMLAQANQGAQGVLALLR